MTKRRDITWKDVANNVILKLISTGQLPFLAIIVILGIMVWRTPQSEIVDVWSILRQMLDRHSGLGYSLSVLCGGGWVVQSKLQRRKTKTELERITNERNAAQQKFFKNPLESSEKWRK